MTDKGATTDLDEELREQIGTVDEATHRVLHDVRTRYGADSEVVSVAPIWRTMNVVERMALVMRDVEHVGKTGNNTQQGYSFRPIDEFMNALHTPLVRHQVVVTPKVLTRDSFERDRRANNGNIIGVTRVVELLVEFTFHAPDGSTLVTVTAGEGADVADKATNKAMAAALKYAIMQTFMVPTRELQDGDAETPDVPSGSRQQQAQNAAVDVTTDVIAQQAAELGREAIMHELDEACRIMDKSRAALTKKWRDTHDVGPIANLDDEDKVPTPELFRFVLTLRPYVAQARAALAREQQPGASTATGEPVRGGGALCEARDGEKVCTKAAGHDGDHQWWG